MSRSSGPVVFRRSVRLLARAGALLAVSALPLTAQAFHYPSLQLPTVATRDYTAAVVGGAGGTALFQWREGWTATRHVQLDVGLSDRKGSESLLLFVGGAIGQELTRASSDQPLDILLTGGAGLGFGSGLTLLRVPVGVSLGHSFELDRGMSLTAYAHPRASLDICSSCGTSGGSATGGTATSGSRTELSLNFDLGANFQFSREFGIRVAGSFSGSDLAGGNDTFAVGLSWTPSALSSKK